MLGELDWANLDWAKDHSITWPVFSLVLESFELKGGRNRVILIASDCHPDSPASNLRSGKQNSINEKDDH